MYQAKKYWYLQIPELEANMDIFNFNLPTNTNIYTFGEPYTSGTICQNICWHWNKVSLKNITSSPYWHWPHLHLYSKWMLSKALSYNMPMFSNKEGNNLQIFILLVKPIPESLLMKWTQTIWVKNTHIYIYIPLWDISVIYSYSDSDSSLGTYEGCWSLLNNIHKCLTFNVIIICTYIFRVLHYIQPCFPAKIP